LEGGFQGRYAALGFQGRGGGFTQNSLIGFPKGIQTKDDRPDGSRHNKEKIVAPPMTWGLFSQLAFGLGEDVLCHLTLGEEKEEEKLALSK